LNLYYQKLNNIKYYYFQGNSFQDSLFHIGHPWNCIELWRQMILSSSKHSATGRW